MFKKKINFNSLLTFQSLTLWVSSGIKKKNERRVNYFWAMENICWIFDQRAKFCLEAKCFDLTAGMSSLSANDIKAHWIVFFSLSLGFCCCWCTYLKRHSIWRDDIKFHRKNYRKPTLRCDKPRMFECRTNLNGQYNQVKTRTKHNHNREMIVCVCVCWPLHCCVCLMGVLLVLFCFISFFFLQLLLLLLLFGVFIGN